MMKLLPSLLAVVFASSDQSRGEEKDRIHVEEFAKQLPIGLLKVSLGTVVTVKCRSFLPTPEESRRKDEFWKRQVEIFEANGKALNPPARMNWIELSYSPVEKPPIGKVIEVLGYEAGSFDGIPDFAGHGDIPIAAGTGFAFHSEFFPMKVVAKKP